MEAELVRAMLLLAHGWSFAGGAMLLLQERTTIAASRFESNAHEVRAVLEAAEGTRRVMSSSTSSYESLAGYRAPPLALASAIAISTNSNAGVRQLLRYFHNAWIDYFATRNGRRSSWFIDLYKVRDLLKRLHRDEVSLLQDLHIAKSDWRSFGQTLNNGDLRHASQVEVAGLSAREVDRLFGLARSWIAAHLRLDGLLVA